jgi:hypothetical protein
MNAQKGPIEWGNQDIADYVFTREETDEFRKWLDSFPKNLPIGEGLLAATCQIHLLAIQWSRLLSLRHEQIQDGGELLDLDEIISDLLDDAIDQRFNGHTP